MTAEERQRKELNQHVANWQEVSKTIDVGGLWENPELVSRMMAVMGRRGGKAKNGRKGFGSLTKKQRQANAVKANEARWGAAKKK